MDGIGGAGGIIRVDGDAGAEAGVGVGACEFGEDEGTSARFLAFDVSARAER